jgi:hypothetical protein
MFSNPREVTAVRAALAFPELSFCCAVYSFACSREASVPEDASREGEKEGGLTGAFHTDDSVRYKR